MAGHEEGGEESRSVRGHSLRVFTDFLKENDPGLKEGKSGHFAGLQRIGDPNDGAAIWTTLTSQQEINDALEARSIEQKAELLAGNKYIQEQAAERLAHQTAGAAEKKGVMGAFAHEMPRDDPPHPSNSEPCNCQTHRPSSMRSR